MSCVEIFVHVCMSVSVHMSVVYLVHYLAVWYYLSRVTYESANLAHFVKSGRVP